MSSYFFPIPAITPKRVAKDFFGDGIFLDSGTSALRIALRMLGLPQGSRVMIPLYVCESVRQAVVAENLDVFFIDTIDDKSFWGDYLSYLKDDIEISCVLIVHLYGFEHPQTADILHYCKQKEIPVIHDCAQSYGISTDKMRTDPYIFSFGPGKSSTAAGGAVLYLNSSTPFICEKRQTVAEIWQSMVFVNERTYPQKNAVHARLLRALIHFFPKAPKTEVRRISAFQLKMAEHVLANFETISMERRKRYDILKGAIAANGFLFIPYDHPSGIFFKMVLGVVQDQATKFKKYLELNRIPFYQLRIQDGCRHLKGFANSFFIEHIFFELSTESSLPISEMERVGKLLKDFK